MNLISEGCLTNKLYRSMFTIYFRRVDQQNFVGVCPLNYIRGLSIKLYRSMSNKLYRRLTNEFSKTKVFCFENRFSYMEKCMCEGVGEDSRHGAGHVDI